MARKKKNQNQTPAEDTASDAPQSFQEYIRQTAGKKPKNLNKGRRKRLREQYNALIGEDGESDLLTDTGKAILADDPANQRAYFNKMLAAGGMDPLASTPFGTWLQNEGFDYFNNLYKNALLDDNDLKYADFFANRYGNVADGTMRSDQTPLATGLPVDTGNPYTSSSGIAAQPLAPVISGNALTPVTTGQETTTPTFGEWRRQEGISRPKGGFNKGRKKRLTERYNAFTSAADAGGTVTAPPTVSTPGAAANDLAEFRKKFLSLSPNVRGETVAGVINTPARWSAWG